MALRVKCKCGKTLNVPSKLADKKIACPGCKKPFRIPLAKFQSAGKPPGAPQPAASPASSKPSVVQVGHAPVAASPPSAQLDLEIADLSGTIGVSPSGVFGEIELDGSGAAHGPIAPIAVDVGDPVELPYARENVAATSPIGRRAGAGIESPKRNYWTDAAGSFVYPFRNVGNILNFIAIAGVTLLGIPISFVIFHLGFIAILLLFGLLIIFGWVRSMYLNVVQETAAGSDDMPGIRLEDGLYEDVVKPALKYTGSYAVALTPAIAYLIGMASGLIPASMQSEYILLAWVAGGLFLWPIILMLFSFNALDMIYRVDLIFATIFRTIVPYLSLWFMLLLVGAISTLPTWGSLLSRVGLNITLPLPSGDSLEGMILFRILDVYFSIVTMRLIGLYYLHFKRRFAIVME